MNKIVTRCAPKPSYWWIVGIFCPLVVAYGAAIFGSILSTWFGFNLQGSTLIFALLSVTAIVTAWIFIRSYRRMFYTLSDDALFLGRGSAATVIPFAEIESIVLGLPDHMPYWLRIQRFNPYGYGAYEAHSRARKDTILLRLTESRYLPLNLTSSDLANGRYLMSELVDLNQSKVVERETYTKREIQGLGFPHYNTIKTIDRNG